MLRDFVADNRGEILRRAHANVAKGNGSNAAETGLAKGLPVFLDQLCEALRRASTREKVDHAELLESASEHGHDLFRQGLSVDQVVHAYGQVCQAITGFAVERESPIDTQEFQTLNLCLDDAIAGAVTAYSQLRESAISADGTERLGILAHEMRNVLNTAILSFAMIKDGVVASAGSTSAMHERSLTALQTLIDRSLADVRLDAGLQNVERVPVGEVIEEVAIGASMVAKTRGLHFVVAPVDTTIIVEADRQILVAAIANLVQNAFKFTRPRSTVTLRANSANGRVLIEVEDECGGLPPGHEELLKPFSQHGRNRTGLGLGLSICMKAARASKGELRITDLPGTGCVFTIDLPTEGAPAPSAARATTP